MFEKNQVIYSEGIGVCKVADTPMLSAGKKEGVRYYLLRSLQDQKRTSYIPVHAKGVNFSGAGKGNGQDVCQKG